MLSCPSRYHQVRLQWSRDGCSQLLATDQASCVSTLVLDAPASDAQRPRHSADFFADSPGPGAGGDLPVIAHRGVVVDSERLMRQSPSQSSLQALHRTAESQNTRASEPMPRGGVPGRQPAIAEVLRASPRAKWWSPAGLRPSAAAFHPATTLLGTQPVIVIGTDCGCVVKWNHVTDRRQVAHGSVPGQAWQVEAAHPTTHGAQAVVQVGSDDVPQREFFEGHQARVLFVGFREHQADRMVTVDAAGVVCTWAYSDACFSGGLWFAPLSRTQLDLRSVDVEGPHGSTETRFRFRGCDQESWSYQGGVDFASMHCSRTERTAAGGLVATYIRGSMLQQSSPSAISSPSTRSDSGSMEVFDWSPSGLLLGHTSTAVGCVHVLHGVLLQVALTPAGRELVVLVEFARRDEALSSTGVGSAGKSVNTGALELGVFLVDLECMKVLPERIRHVSQRPAPRGPSCVAISPVSHTSGTDIIYLYHDRCVHVYSVATGQLLHRIDLSLDPLTNFDAVDLAVSPSHGLLGVVLPEARHPVLFSVQAPGFGVARTTRRSFASRSPRWMSTPRRLHHLPAGAADPVLLDDAARTALCEHIAHTCADAAVQVVEARRRAAVNDAEARRKRAPCPIVAAKIPELDSTGLGAVAPASWEAAAELCEWGSCGGHGARPEAEDAGRVHVGDAAASGLLSQTTAIPAEQPSPRAAGETAGAE